ncbi:MAG: hypothetical protein CMH50_09315 [Myxococcales bacterium]|nr:hypothetical protein [Myxococcales bacterium]|tara:strand:- start:270 stop:1007 length:738 start_codon:yes stop_codon:yes gene_type:complete
MVGTILLTRIPTEEALLRSHLERRGFDVLQWPGIELRPCRQDDGREGVIHSLRRNDAVVFPSPGAVRCAWEQYPDLSQLLETYDLTVFGQGPGTAAALRDRGRFQVSTPERRDAVGLAAHICDAMESSHRILLLGGNLAGTTLPDRLQAEGFQLERRVIYENSVPSGLCREPQPLDCVVFGSPSAARNHLEQNPWLHVVPAVTYGATTAKWLEQHSKLSRIEMAKQPTMVAVLEAIQIVVKGAMA